MSKQGVASTQPPDHANAASSHDIKGRAPTQLRRLEICVIDDDDAIRTYLRRQLTKEGYRVRGVPARTNAMEGIAADPPDVLVLSLDTPDAGGLAGISSLRELSTVPIVAVSVRDNEDTIVDALVNGADDFIKKPFGIREFVARIQSVLRRAARERGVPPLVLSGSLKVDLVHRRVWSQGQEVHITAKPYEVLRILVENAGKVVPHSEILAAVWGGDRRRGMGYLRLAIRKLRRQLEPNPSRPTHILTKSRVGYRLVAQRRPVRNHTSLGRSKRHA